MFSVPLLSCYCRSVLRVECLEFLCYLVIVNLFLELNVLSSSVMLSCYCRSVFKALIRSVFD